MLLDFTYYCSISTVPPESLRSVLPLFVAFCAEHDLHNPQGTSWLRYITNMATRKNCHAALICSETRNPQPLQQETEPTVHFWTRQWVEIGVMLDVWSLEQLQFTACNSWDFHPCGEASDPLTDRKAEVVNGIKDRTVKYPVTCRLLVHAQEMLEW